VPGPDSPGSAERYRDGGGGEVNGKAENGETGWKPHRQTS